MQQESKNTRNGEGQAWCEERLNRNEGSKKATHIDIAKIVVRFNVTVANYKEKYAQYSKEFAVWPSFTSLRLSYPQIIKKVKEIKKLLRQQEKSLS